MAKRILVADNHGPTRRLIRTVLESDRSDVFEVFEAATGTECLNAVDRGGRFDLILLDVGLPDRDGFAVCSTIREVDTQVPIVFITVDDDLKSYAAGGAVGGDSCVVKPIGRASLLSIVASFTSQDRKGARLSKRYSRLLEAVPSQPL